MNNYRIILYYYCVFHLTLFGLDAEIVHFDLKSIHGLRTVYGAGTLTYYPYSDSTENTSMYVFFENGNIPTNETIDKAVQTISHLVEQAGLDLIDDILDTKEMDKSAGNLFKIMRKDIEHYVYDDQDDDVSIIYSGKYFTLNFTNIQDAKNFVECLPSSAKVMEKTTYESLRTLAANLHSLTTF